MDTKKDDTDAKTAPEAPAMPVPLVPLHGPVDVIDDSLEGLHSAFRALAVEEVDTNPVKRKRERAKDAGESMADEGVDHGHDPTSESSLEGAPSASGLHASPSPTTTTLPNPDPAAATSAPITTPPMAEGTGLTGMRTYAAYGVTNPPLRFQRPLLPVSQWLLLLRRAGMRRTIIILYPLREPMWMFLGMQP